jgi:hypothetical protein
MVRASSYGPALFSKVPKNPASIAASEKNRKRGNAHGDNMVVYVKCDYVFFLENKKSKCKKKVEEISFIKL